MRIEYQIIILLFIHWVADFLFQTKDMATNKSKSNMWLFTHVSTYTTVYGAVGLFFFPPMQVIGFCAATFFFHFITDYFTSRLTSKLYAAKKYYGFPSFFSVIGGDQWLHFVQLILCYTYFTTH